MKTSFTDLQAVTSSAKISDIANRFFLNKPSYLKYHKNDIRIKCYRYINEKITIGIPVLRTIPDPAVIYAGDNNDVAYFYLKFSESIQPDIIVFEVVKCIVMKGERNPERNIVNPDIDQQSGIYITNIITETMLENDLLFENKKYNTILEYTESELMRYFTYARLFMKLTNVNDRRMQFISDFNRPLTVNQIGEDPLNTSEDYEYYMKYIYPKDRFKKEYRSVKSEAILPVYYKNKIPYGYLQVNRSMDLTRKDIEIAEKFVKSIEKYFQKIDIFRVITDKLFIYDISAGGLSVIQFDKTYFNILNDNTGVCFDLILPNQKSINVFATVKHSRLLSNGVTRTGFKIEKIGSDDIEDFNSYFASGSNNDNQS